MACPICGRGNRGNAKYCVACGSPLGARPRTDGTRRYVCLKGPGKPGCGKVAILAEPIEALIAEAVYPIAATGQFSVSKFNAAWRRDAYRTRDVSEQQAFLAGLRQHGDVAARPAFGGGHQAAAPALIASTVRPAESTCDA